MSDHEMIARQVVHIVPQIMRNVSANLRCHAAGVVPAHFRLLGILSHQSYNLSELAEIQSVTLATMSNSVATMVERGWVERVPAEHDRRVVQVKLTPTGQQMLHNIHFQMEQRIVELVKTLSEEEVEDLEKGLRVLSKMLEQGNWNFPHDHCAEMGVEKQGGIPAAQHGDVERKVE